MLASAFGGDGGGNDGGGFGHGLFPPVQHQHENAGNEQKHARHAERVGFTVSQFQSNDNTFTGRGRNDFRGKKFFNHARKVGFLKWGYAAERQRRSYSPSRLPSFTTAFFRLPEFLALRQWWAHAPFLRDLGA
jgi:hypothetical protein